MVVFAQSSEHMTAIGQKLHILGLTRTSLSIEFIVPTLSGTYRDPEQLLLWNSTLPNAARWQLKALKAFEDEPCPGVLCKIPATKQNMKLSAKIGSKLSSPTCRTATFCDKVAEVGQSTW